MTFRATGACLCHMITPGPRFKGERLVNKLSETFHGLTGQLQGIFHPVAKHFYLLRRVRLQEVSTVFMSVEPTGRLRFDWATVLRLRCRTIRNGRWP